MPSDLHPANTGCFSVDEEGLVPISELADAPRESDFSLAPIKDELEQIRLMVQDYMRAIEPALRPLSDLPGQLQELSELAEDVRSSANDAQRAAVSIRPLERTLLRIADEAGNAGTGERNDIRAAGMGRLFRK
ncbi:hypothetical protein [Minwuia sp.]|uniref:hypothetical protein n=1 Tax=Minwuia sp. TaxID=2493630 RepID=UPI003A8DA3C9